ncbi:MBL fold metallo-hydrolase [Pontibacillus salicampi]|uniref:MBL fold metallo-hydrolase n=1 Tax=Pontibacillus salicampi TaxID=1449801 RepID=A0ABV6LK82_9BACI
MIEVKQFNHTTALLNRVSFLGYSMSVYQFIIDGMLIDGGAPKLLKKLIPFYKEYSNDIDFVSITHNHEDHTGTSAWLQKEYNLPIYIHEGAIEDCTKKAAYPLYRKLMWGERLPFHAHPYPETINTRNHEWSIIPTPGHEKHHVCLFNKENGRLFTGDLFVTPKTKLIMEEESIPQIISSLRTVQQLDFEEMYCCHSGYHSNGKEMIAMKLRYLEEISDKVHHMYNQGKPVSEINKELFPKNPSLIYYSSRQWDSKHIIRSILQET